MLTDHGCVNVNAETLLVDAIKRCAILIIYSTEARCFV